MTDDLPSDGIREAVAVFRSAQALEDAIDELQSSGFDRAEISLLAAERAVESKLGHAYERVRDLEDDAATPRTFYVSKESIGDAEGGLVGGLLYVGALAAVGGIVASGGSLAAAIAGGALAGGAGGVIGATLARLLGQHHADHVATQLGHGGLLLWVHLRDAEHEARAKAILAKHGGTDVHVHSLPAAA